MAKEFGEGFTRPIDPYTGAPIPGHPRMAIPNTNQDTSVNGPVCIYLSDNLGPGENDRGMPEPMKK